MKKAFIILIFYYLSIPALKAQQQYYNWYITAGPGAMAYYGDLSHTISSTKINVPAYQLSIGRNISSSLSLTLQGSYGQISGNDRARDWSGTLRTDNPNFSRGLNFQTDIRNASLLLSYRFNNGEILSKHAAVAPYLYGGVGVTDFTVNGDLYADSGQPYYYWNDNTIRNQPQQPANEATAQAIGQNGNFETRLSSLGTEQNYPTQVFTIPAGVGVQFRLSDRFSANLQAGANFTYTGYLDDVNGMYRIDYTSPAQAYAANPTSIIRDRRGNGENDMYFSAFLSVGYHFNFKKKSFTPPVVYTGYKSPQQVVALESNDPNVQEEEIKAITPEMGPAPLSRTPATVAPQQNLNQNNIQRNEIQQPDRQTVDINLHIMLEDGKMVVDTISRQLPDTSVVIRPRQRINSLQEINKPASTIPDARDTNEIEIPSRKIQTGAAPQSGNRQNQVASIPAVEEEVRMLRREVDSLKRTGNTPDNLRVRDQQVNTNTQPEKETVVRDNVRPQALQNTQPQDRPDNSAEIAALRREVDLLRQDLNRERNTNARQTTPQVIQRDRVVNPALGLGVQAGSGQYNQKEMEQLQNQLTGVQAQLDTLRAQNKVEANPVVDNKIDSLLNLVNKLQMMNAAPANEPNLNQNEADKAQQAQLIESLQNQVAGLNQSLKSMETSVAAGIDTLSMGMPYTALGNTVVYYNVNDAQLKEADKQRLNILGSKLKAEPAVLLLIKGFTDQTGNADYNLKLSQKRAENVKNYFVNQMGVKPEQILINYFGQQKASSTASSAYDRRVELELFREN